MLERFRGGEWSVVLNVNVWFQVSETADAASKAFEEGKQKGQQAASDLRDKAVDVAHDAKVTVQQTTEQVKEGAADAAHAAKQNLAAAADATADKAAEVGTATVGAAGYVAGVVHDR